ncbi:MAG: DUF3047 domain-containing protein [Giesbergeria sp.]|jgi:hypothetical protein
MCDPNNGQYRPSMFVLLLALTASAAAAAVRVGDFAAAGDTLPAPWKVVQLDKRVPATRYRPLQWEGRAAIEASAHASMALLARPLTVDLQTTPVLCWLWRVDDVLRQADLSRKAGDDYAARVYVAFTLPPESLGVGLRMKLALGRSLYGDLVPDAAVNYVWDNRHPVGTRAFNAYTDRAAMVVQRSGKEQVGRWVSERANVLADAVQAFGELPFKASLLAVASDTDNTGEQARAGFAELHFVAADEPCQFTGAQVP